MEPFDFQPSIHLLYGENRIDQLGELSKEVADPSRVLVVTDPGIASAGLLKRAMASLETAEITVFALEITENGSQNLKLSACGALDLSRPPGV